MQVLRCCNTKTKPCGILSASLAVSSCRFNQSFPRKMLENWNERSRHKSSSLYSSKNITKKQKPNVSAVICGGGGRIRFAAAEPRRWQQSTGLLPRAAFRIHPQIQKVQHQTVLDFSWWGRTDSNHRSETQQIYSLSPLATRELPHIQLARLRVTLWHPVLEPVDGLEPPTY